MRLSAILALVVLCAGCGSSNSSPSSPTSPTAPVVIQDPQNPVPGYVLDTSWHRMVDGAGNPGPIEGRFIRLTREGPTWISFEAEARMDPIPNPSLSQYLGVMRLAVFGSADCMQRTGPNGANRETDFLWGVRNGESFYFKRIPVGQTGQDGSPGTPGAQFLFVTGDAKCVLITAMYGPAHLGFASELSAEPCPSYEIIARQQVSCVLRMALPAP